MIEGEAELKLSLDESLRKEFDLARRLLRFGLGIARRPIGNVQGLDTKAEFIANALYAKACKQYRSIVELCKIGRGTEAATLTRSLLETLLATGFILRRRFRLVEFVDGVKTPVVESGEPFDTTVRALLFELHQYRESEGQAKDLRKTRGLKLQGRRLQKQSGLPTVAETKKRLSPWWRKRWKAGKQTYSTVSARALAASLGPTYERVYMAVYRSLSWNSHAVDIVEHLKPQTDEEPTHLIWIEDVERIRSVATLATALYIGCLETMNDRLEYGVIVNTALAAFGCELQRIE